MLAAFQSRPCKGSSTHWSAWTIAINEAIARNGNAGKISSANSRVSQGDADAAADKPTNAIDDYKRAFSDATSA
jgi:hypothetical protein